MTTYVDEELLDWPISNNLIPNIKIHHPLMDSTRIPKRIMQTWKTDTLPSKWQASQDAIRRLLPDWDYLLMTDDMNRELVATHFPDFLPTYDSFPYPIQRADAVRYCYLYVYGGWYLDCDIEILHSIEQLMIDPTAQLIVVPSANIETVYTNAMMASIPGHPIWLMMLEHMKQPLPWWKTIDRHLEIMESTGPVGFSKVVNSLAPELMTSVIALDAQRVNPYNICDTEFNRPGVFMRPLEGSSWVTTSGKVYQYCYCKSYQLLASLFIIIFAILIVIILSI